MKVNSRPWDSQYSVWELALFYQIRMEACRLDQKINFDTRQTGQRYQPEYDLIEPVDNVNAMANVDVEPMMVDVLTGMENRPMALDRR